MEKGYRLAGSSSYGYDRSSQGTQARKSSQGSQEEIETIALNFMSPEDIKTHTPKQLRSLVKKYQEEQQRHEHATHSGRQQ